MIIRPRFISALASTMVLLIGWTDSLPAHASKLRVVILTDNSNEPDDQQSLVRFLT